MLEQFFNSLTDSSAQSIDIKSALIISIASIAIGVFISVIYMVTHSKEGHNGSLAITLVLLPAIIAVIILLVGSNVARAFSLAGAFSIIRFRSYLSDPRDITYVFFTLAVGLACGMGYIGYAVLFAGLLGLVMWLLYLTGYATQRNILQLRITLPESMDFQGLFDDEFKEFTDEHRLQRIKTTDFGSLFEISYTIRLKRGADQKRFMDKLRAKNRNLNISLLVKPILGEQG